MVEFKKDCGYRQEDNFIIEGELTVTITLNEYRELVSAKAIKEDAERKLRNEKYTIENEIKKLKEQIVKLTTETEEDNF